MLHLRGFRCALFESTSPVDHHNRHHRKNTKRLPSRSTSPTTGACPAFPGAHHVRRSPPGSGFSRTRDMRFDFHPKGGESKFEARTHPPPPRATTCRLPELPWRCRHLTTLNPRVDCSDTAFPAREGRPQLAAWFETFAQRESMQATYVDPSVDPLKVSGSGAFAPK